MIKIPPLRPYPTISAYILAFLLFACSYSSNTIIAAPSLITNPSLSLSKGREAVLGSSFLVESERALRHYQVNVTYFENAPIANGQTAASAPPAIITSASPNED
jgi:hypothetical protein